MAIWRFQVTTRSDQVDPLGIQTYRTLRDFGIRSVMSVQTSRLFLVNLNEAHSVNRIANELLVDSVVEECSIIGENEMIPQSEESMVVETFFKPGVMDNVGNSIEIALKEIGIFTTGVRTGRRYEIYPVPNDADISRIMRLLGNACIEDVVLNGSPVGPAPCPPVRAFELVVVPLREMDNSTLEILSREQHLFLSLDEMQTIRQYFVDIGRDPTDLELETLAQTWSEHCVHKTLKSAVDYRGTPFPSSKEWLQKQSVYQQSEIVVHYDNLLSDTIARATHELIEEGRGPECLSIFEDNAGVIGFDESHGIAFKAETHNHPSAIEPYGGAATGLGGVIRDILGCGLGARPVANTSVFCVAPPCWPLDSLPKGIIHPKVALKSVVAGVRDYGNCMGIPTVNGAVHFDPRFLGNPLVYCGCVGLIPRNRVAKQAQPGDAIVLMGGRTGRDGIHGATFSSAELSDNHEDEFAHAVQIGNPVEEKKVLDVILQARDLEYFSSITDCGAGGLSSAVGEMGETIGVEVNLDCVPLKYDGLKYDEIWISEAQERMVLAVPQNKIEPLLALSQSEDVEATVIGQFTDTNRLVVRYKEIIVGDLDMSFLHHGLPQITRTAEWYPPAQDSNHRMTNHKRTPVELLTQHLCDPSVSSKHWIIRQYDHEVRSGSIIKPIVGPGEGPSDAAVIRPKLNSDRGVAIGCGMSLSMGDVDPYWSAVSAIDEAIRNIVCVGGNPKQTAILDNFCWPSSDDDHAMGALVRACVGCYDTSKAYALPFISGKDSLNNVFSMSRKDTLMIQDVIHEYYPDMSAQFQSQQNRCVDKLSIPYSLLISALSIVEDVNRCITSVPKLIDSTANLFFVGSKTNQWDDIVLAEQSALHISVSNLISDGIIVAAHDCGSGGIAAAVAEMSISSGLETELFTGDCLFNLFDTVASGYIIQACDLQQLHLISEMPGVQVCEVAHMRDGGHNAMFRFADRSYMSIRVSELREIWRAPLDW